jgi:hypothetical protein
MIETDEDIDISAIYVLGNKTIDFCSSEASEIIRRAMEKAAKEVRRKHKEAGVPMVISRDGKIVYLQPDEIEVD